MSHSCTTDCKTESNQNNHSCCGHHHHHHNHDHGGHASGLSGFVRTFGKELASGLLLVVCLILQHTGVLDSVMMSANGFNWLTLLCYVIAILPVGFPVFREMIESWGHGSVMNEFTLMVAASIGAFIIGEYPEAVAVLLFYSIGEKLEDVAGDDVRRRVKSLLGRMPDTATVIENGVERKADPKTLKPGSIILVRPGERVPVDASLMGDSSVEFDTSAITGESVPRSFNPGEELPSGIIPVDTAVRGKTIRQYSESSMSRILQMIESAQAQKSPTESMLRRITRWYTPVVFILAVLLFCLPWIYYSLPGNGPFEWMRWLRRSLVFLVCSCPCALVVSIPLSYFVSLGTASKLGLLFKGSKYIDGMRNLRSVVFDKTGTLTTGRFHVESVVPAGDLSANDVVAYAAALDKESNHPLALAICKYADTLKVKLPEVTDVKTVKHGMEGILDGKTVIAGSTKLMKSLNIAVPQSKSEGSEICVAYGNRYLGSIYLADTIKSEAADAISALHSLGVKNVEILSGDRNEAVASTARRVGADSWHAELLPADKQHIIGELRKQGKVAFVGDGINDAPAIAASDVGVAMGTMGTGMAMDTADVVIAGDNLSRIASAIRLSRRVQTTVIQNVSFALGVKALVMILGAFGIATLWAAVFADTGVTLITILWTLIRLRKL